MSSWGDNFSVCARDATSLSAIEQLVLFGNLDELLFTIFLFLFKNRKKVIKF